MKILNNMRDVCLFIEKDSCFKYKYIKEHVADKSYNLDGAKEDDLIVKVYDDLKDKIYHTRLMEGKNGKYIDIVGCRYYVKEEVVCCHEE